MGRYLPLVLKNCRRNRRRTTLTVLSLGISMCLLGVLLAIYHAFYFADAPPDQALRLITRNRVSLGVSMPESYIHRIRRVPGVEGAVIDTWFGGVYKDARDPNNFFGRFATEPAQFFRVFREMRVPEDQQQAWIRDRTGCIVGAGLVKKLGFKIGDRITLKGDIYPVTLELTVRGIYEYPTYDEGLYFNYDYLEESLSAGRKGQVGTFAVLVDSADHVAGVARAIDDEFRNSTAETKTESEAAFSLSFVNMLGNVKLFLLSICGAVTFTILLVAGNTMAMSVRERVREVGILKTLGFTADRILMIVVGEALAISLAGGVLGWFLGAGLCAVLRHAPGIMFAQIRSLSIAPAVALLLVGVAAFIGIASSILPAWHASRISIVDALRSED